MKQEWILEAENLYYKYEENETPSLNGVNIKIARGEKVAFLGANGSGKSTFFLCLNGILRPDKGQVRLNGEAVDYSRKGLLSLRKKVGIVFQDPDSQLFFADVYQEISFGILNMGLSEEEARREVDRIIERLGISSLKSRPTHALSGGQKKMVSIADILVMHPEVVILDEPAAALDAKHVEKVNRAVEDMTKEGITVLMATHDMDYAYEWADRMVLMCEGKVLKEGTPREVCADKEALKKTNLTPPAVLTMFEALTKGGRLDGTLIPPASMEELKDYILKGDKE